MFHVKRLQTEETAINLFIDISEVQQVAIVSLLPYILVQSPMSAECHPGGRRDSTRGQEVDPDQVGDDNI